MGFVISDNGGTKRLGILLLLLVAIGGFAGFQFVKSDIGFFQEAGRLNNSSILEKEGFYTVPNRPLPKAGRCIPHQGVPKAFNNAVSLEEGQKMTIEYKLKQELVRLLSSYFKVTDVELLNPSETLYYTFSTPCDFDICFKKQQDINSSACAQTIVYALKYKGKVEFRKYSDSNRCVKLRAYVEAAVGFPSVEGVVISSRKLMELRDDECVKVIENFQLPKGQQGTPSSSSDYGGVNTGSDVSGGDGGEDSVDVVNNFQLPKTSPTPQAQAQSNNYNSTTNLSQPNVTPIVTIHNGVLPKATEMLGGRHVYSTNSDGSSSYYGSGNQARSQTGNIVDGYYSDQDDGLVVIVDDDNNDTYGSYGYEEDSSIVEDNTNTDSYLYYQDYQNPTLESSPSNPVLRFFYKIGEGIANLFDMIF